MEGRKTGCNSPELSNWFDCNLYVCASVCVTTEDDLWL
jgi:hypothetical protein